jgi:site-specific recombinase XerD
MPFFFIHKKSPYYWIGFYDKEQTNGNKRPQLNTKIKVTDADWQRYQAWQTENVKWKMEGKKKQKPKPNLQGNKELKERLKKFSIALAERDMYKKAGLELKVTKNLKEGLEDYLYNHPKITASTADSYKYAMAKFIEAVGNKNIHECTGKDCSTFIRLLIKQKRSEATQNSYTKRMWVLFNYFIKNKWIHDNIIVITSVPEYNPDPIPEDELKTIFNYYANKRDFVTFQLKKPNKNVPQENINRQILFIRLMLETGFRQSTLMLLNKVDFDIKEKRIKAINAKRSLKKFYFPIHRRIAQIVPDLLALQENRRRLRLLDAENLFGYKDYHSLKFWQRDMNLLFTKGVIRQRYQMYQLRDTFNSRLANAGVDESTRNELMDHYDGSINRKHYTKYQMEYLLTVLDKALKGKV